MANDLNQCNFIGRLGNDPEIRYDQQQNPVANISLAVGWKSKQKEGVEWVRCVAFGKLAEIIGQYLKKGSKVFISGSFRTRKWQNQQGQDQYTTEIIANELQMLDSRTDGQQPAQGYAAPAAQPIPQQQQSPHSSYRQPPPGYTGTQPRQQQPAPPPASGGSNDFNDDIPFAARHWMES